MTEHSAEDAMRANQATAPAGGIPESLLARTGFLLSTVGRQFRAATEQALAPLGITPLHYGVLAVLAAHGSVAQTAVGQTLHIDKSSMVTIMDHLERQGLVERQRNPRNRRAYELLLTAAGSERVEEADRLITAREQAGLSALDDSQRSQLHQLLVRLLNGPAPAQDAAE